MNSLLKMRSFLLIPVLLCILVPAALGQVSEQGNLSEFYSYGDNYFLEVATMPSAGPKGRVVVSFRLTYDLLTFRKASQSGSRAGLYVATPSMYVEAIGGDGVIGDRVVWRDTVRTADYAQTNAKKLFIPGSVELALRPGVYTIRYIFDEATPGSGFTQSMAPIKVDDFNSPSPAIGLPIFLRELSGDTLVAAGVDGAALFGRRIRAYVPMSSADEPKELKYELLTLPKKDQENDRGKVLQTGLGRILGGVTVSAPIPSGNDLLFMVRHRESDSAVPPRSYGAIIDARTDDLDVGEYLLLLTYSSGASSVTDSVRFRLRWVDMPFTMTKVEYAIRALYPIASDDLLDEMLSGDRERQVAAFRKFWGERDPTPGTAYNEAMAEYYRRVDHAFFNFRSIGQKDGAFTDRGKIYLLYGPPTEINREMRPDAVPREVWSYRNVVAQEFVFIDEAKTGEYRLVEYHDL